MNTGKPIKQELGKGPMKFCNFGALNCIVPSPCDLSWGTIQFGVSKFQGALIGCHTQNSLGRIIYDMENPRYYAKKLALALDDFFCKNYNIKKYYKMVNVKASKRYNRKGRQVRKNRRARKPRMAYGKAFKRAVKSVLSANVENKMRQNGGSLNLGPTTYASFQSNSIIPLTPYYEAGLPASINLDITQGTGISNRIANSIKTKSGYFRAVLYPSPYNVTTNPTPKPVLVTQWIFKLKSGITDSTGSVLSTLLNNYFKDQNSSFGCQNSLGDVVAKVNPDWINLLSRRVYKLGYAADAGTGAVAANQNYANNDYKHNHIIKMSTTKYLRKRIRYTDNNAQPLTSTTWMVFTVAYADGSAMPSTHVPAYMNFENDYQFEDA